MHSFFGENRSFLNFELRRDGIRNLLLIYRIEPSLFKQNSFNLLLGPGRFS